MIEPEYDCQDMNDFYAFQEKRAEQKRRDESLDRTELHFNEATMMAALQHYFDTVLFVAGMAPRVVAVRQVVKSYGDDVFVVGVNESQEAANARP